MTTYKNAITDALTALRDLRYGIFKDEQAVNDLLDLLIEKLQALVDTYHDYHNTKLSVQE